MPSTSRRRRRRRYRSRYYVNPRTERLKRLGIIVLVALMVAIAAMLVWAAVYADRPQR